MSVFKYHIFVCQNERDATDSRGCCMARGAAELVEAFREELKARNLKGLARANKAGCMDQCAQGPVVVIYPEATWYARVRASDVKEIVSAMLEGRRVDRLLYVKTDGSK
jgi:(2Fe-2S) ferredoxin